MLSILLVPAAVADYNCLHGPVSNIELEYIHVQDFSASFMDQGPELADQLENTFAYLDHLFHGEATFAIRKAVDKNLEDGEFTCDEDLTGGLYPYGHKRIFNSLDEVANFTEYQNNDARPSLYDSVMEAVDDWAGSGSYIDEKTGKTTIRIVSTASDECSREAGHWHKNTEAQVSQWTSGERGYEFPLSGILPSCQFRDYPTRKELGYALSQNNVSAIWLLAGESYHTCKGDEAGWGLEGQTIQQWYEANQAFMLEEEVHSTTKMDLHRDMSDLGITVVHAINELVCHSHELDDTPSAAPPTAAPTTSASKPVRHTPLE